jgi:CRP-like cAMP-binding protein
MSMPARSRIIKGNRLLGSLSRRDRGLLAKHLVPLELPLRHVFERPNKAIADVYFPETGIASIVAQHPNGIRIEIGVIGCEGMSGSAIVLGNQSSPHSTYIQVAGNGHRLPVTALRRAMQQSRSLQASLLKFVQAFMVQTAHSAIANARATVKERLARWLLMAHDRVPDNKLALTHEFLSLMMAVRRAGVTESLQDFEERGLVSCSRGEIVLLNRSGIEKIAGHYYGTPEAEYRRLIK